MKKILIALMMLVSTFSHGATPFGNISRTNTIYTAAEAEASFATIDYVDEVASDVVTNTANIATNASDIAVIETNSVTKANIGRPSGIVSEATSSRTLALSDVGKYIRLTGSATAINLPANAVVDWAAEEFPPVFYFYMATENTPTFSGGLTVGAGINDPKGIVAALDEEGDAFCLIWVGTNSWDVL